jgi:HAD superfamily hydrolase (TIGR01450 family)
MYKNQLEKRSKAAIILAAGIGSRLYPITEKFPKSLVKVCGREILDYQITGYIKSGISEEHIYIVIGYMPEMMQKFLSINYPDVNVIINHDYLTTNNMYSLYLALTKIVSNSDFKPLTILINNADCLYDEQLMKEFVFSEHKNAIASEINVYFEESMKIVTKNNIIADISKKIKPEDAAGVSVDLYKYSDEAIQRLYAIIKEYIEVKKDLKQWTEVAFPLLFNEINVYPFDIKHKKWVEVDNMDDLLQADRKFCSFDISNKKAIICDLDGTLYIGNRPIDPAIDFINKTRYVYDFYFLTNNTSCPPMEYVKKLSTYGLNVTEREICTPFTVLIKYLKKKQYKSVYMVATNAVIKYMSSQLPDIDYSYNYDKNEAIILTYDKEITYQKMMDISLLLNNKPIIEYIATHNDICCPTEFGNIPDIGSIIEMIYMTTERKPSLIFGKPNIKLVEEIINKYGKEKIVIVGDRLYTDRLLAENALVDFICVLSGESSRLDVALYKDTRNMLVVKDLGCLSIK